MQDAPDDTVDEGTADGRGDPHDRRELAGLPPGASTKGEPDSTLRGSDRDQAPYEEAPAGGRLAPDGDNPPP